MHRLAAAVFTMVATAGATPQTLDCPLRQVAVDFAQSLQPFRAAAVHMAVADALNGAMEARNCSATPNKTVAPADVQLLRGPQGVLAHENARVLSFPLPPSNATAVYVDAARGSDDSGDGSEARPFASLQRALASVRAARAKTGVPAAASHVATLVLRAGVFHLRETLALTSADSQVTFQAYPGEDVSISGGVAVQNVSWAAFAPPNRTAWTYQSGGLVPGFDVLPPKTTTITAAQSLCAATPACVGIYFNGSAPTDPSTQLLVSFSRKPWYAFAPDSGAYLLNRGYLAGGANLWVADTSPLGLRADVDALRVGGLRAIRARWPNVIEVEDMNAMQVQAAEWTPQAFSDLAAFSFNPPYPLRNDSVDDHNGVPWFSQFRLGYGGGCGLRFTPPASYFCANGTQGGGPTPYFAPVAMGLAGGGEGGPHTPYVGDVSRAAVYTWRGERWFSWVFAVDSVAYDPVRHFSNFSFSLSRGGNQGSRAGDRGEEFVIDNVLEELDAPGEWYWDRPSGKLYLWLNDTAVAPPPGDGSVVASQMSIIVNATGTKADPVVGVSFLGLTFSDAGPSFFSPHGTPSGGDWALARSGALFFEGTEGTTVAGCLFDRLDGNGVFFSGYNRNGSITQSEFAAIGETAIAQWGYTDGSPVPGMGFDATAGTQPRGTYVGFNVAHDVGIFVKQNSFYFQSESFENTIEGNIAYNGPRAGINFNDGLSGGSIVSRNLLFNFCRESSDHGPFNSWNRQVYLFDGPNGTATVQKVNDTIMYNMILANYQSSLALDHDDGSAFYYAHHNVLWAARNALARYGQIALKTDFGGHSVIHQKNLDLFTKGYGVFATLPSGVNDYSSNYLYMLVDGGIGETFGNVSDTFSPCNAYNNTIWTPNGTEAAGVRSAISSDPSPGTASAWPDDSLVLSIARTLLSLPAQ